METRDGNRGQTGRFLIFSSGHGALSSSGCGRCSSSCYATRESAGIHSLVRCRTHGVFRPASAGCATLSTVAHRLLPDVEPRSSDRTLRKCTYSGRPFGSDEFVKKLELEIARPLTPRKGGRPAKISERNQTMFDFDLPT